MECNWKNLKTINIPTTDAYGEPKAELKQEIPNAQIPPEIKPEVGLQLMSKAPNGKQFPMVITEVKDDSDYS